MSSSIAAGPGLTPVFFSVGPRREAARLASRQATRGQCEQHRGHCIAARAASLSALPMVFSNRAEVSGGGRGQRPVQSGQVLETFSNSLAPVKLSAESVEYKLGLSALDELTKEKCHASVTEPGPSGCTRRWCLRSNHT